MDSKVTFEGKEIKDVSALLHTIRSEFNEIYSAYTARAMGGGSALGMIQVLLSEKLVIRNPGGVVEPLEDPEEESDTELDEDLSDLEDDPEDDAD